MNKLEQIVEDIKALEQELLLELQKKQDEYYYVIKDKKVQFEEETRQYHKALATRLHVYLANATLPQGPLCAPFLWKIQLLLLV